MGVHTADRDGWDRSFCRRHSLGKGMQDSGSKEHTENKAARVSELPGQVTDWKAGVRDGSLGQVIDALNAMIRNLASILELTGY